MNRDKERSKLQIVSLCVLLAMAILFAGLIAISRQTKGIFYKESFSKFEQQDGRDVYTGKIKGEHVTILCYEDGNVDIVEFFAGTHYQQTGRVEHLSDTIVTEFEQEIPHIRIFRNDALLFDGGYDENMKMFFDENGELASMVSVKVYPSDDPWHEYEFTAGNIYYLTNDPELTVRGNWVIYAVMVFISLLFAAEIAFPETLFYLNHFLSVRDPEPSDFFWAMHNISCVALPLLALIGYLIAVRTVA